MGTVLQHNSHPIAYYSKMVCPHLQLASAYVRELHVITNVVRKWRHYLLGHTFTILTDHRSLKNLMSQVIKTPNKKSICPSYWDMITLSSTYQGLRT